MNGSLNARSVALNQAHKEMDEAYHRYALAHGLSDAAFWILYSICAKEELYTQRELCAEWRYSPQTINSALKGLEKRGVIKLILSPGSQKNKQILLTPSGKALAEKTVFPLYEAEQNSFGRMSEKERELLLSLTQKHIALIRAEIDKMI